MSHRLLTRAPFVALLAVASHSCGFVPEDTDTVTAGPTATKPRGVAWRTDASAATRPEGMQHDVAPITSTFAPAGAKLVYRGGRVVSNVRVVQVLYGAGSYLSQVTSTATPSMATFYEQIANSAYFDWLTEYNTPASGGTNQRIGHGTFASQIQITPATSNNSSTISDAQIQAELATQIKAGVVPLPTSDATGNTNTYYAIFFPHGKTITAFGENSCQFGGFCAYHGTIANVGGHEIYYGVHPDMQSGSGCDTGCGGGTVFANYQSVASHELVETVTDAEVGLAPTTGPPLAWYDQTYGEIGDICNAQQGTIAGADGQTYTVQEEFSNAANDCIVSRPDPSQLLFGGMYQVDDCGAVNTVVNPFTGQASCPSGYQAMLRGRVIGPESNCGSNQFFCAAPAANLPSVPPHTWAFGGLYQVDDCGRNTLGNAWDAGAVGCPAGAQAIAVGRIKAPESSCGATQYMCGFPDAAPTARTLAFAGTYQVGDCGTNTIPNQFTGLTSCPTNTVTIQSGRVKVPEGGKCGGNQYLCSPPASIPCFDGVQDLNETDVDCGGGTCRACDLGGACWTDSDCTSSLCSAGVCSLPPVVCSTAALAGSSPLDLRAICPSL